MIWHFGNIVLLMTYLSGNIVLGLNLGLLTGLVCTHNWTDIDSTGCTPEMVSGFINPQGNNPGMGFRFIDMCTR